MKGKKKTKESIFQSTEGNEVVEVKKKDRELLKFGN